MEGFSLLLKGALPVVAHGELDLARVVGGLDLAKVAVEGAAIQAECADGVVVIRHVEQVVELAAEDQGASFAEEVEALLQRHVHVAELRARKRVAAAVAGANRL